jgi:hypothetical protein
VEPLTSRLNARRLDARTTGNPALQSGVHHLPNPAARVDGWRMEGASSRLRRTGCVALLALALTVVLAIRPGGAGAATPGTSPEFFGVNGAYLRDFVQPQFAPTLEGLATSMGEQGIDWARLTFDQAVDEKKRGEFNWYAPDAMVAALARHGVRGAASFVGTAWWAIDPVLRDQGRCGPRGWPYEIDGWSEWVAAAASRYGTNGTFWAQHPELPRLPIKRWEIGNEVNSGIFWCPAANPEQYAAVYSASAEAIRRADPAAEVMVAGLAPRFGWKTPTDLDVPAFLSRMTAADPSLRGSIPSVAIHPYAGTPEGALAKLAQFRQAMRDAGMPSTPMIANEIGWYTQGPAGSLLAGQDQRATNIATVANQFWRTDCGVQGLAPYSWITLEKDPLNSEHWYGLADAVTGEPNAGGLAYGRQIHLALGESGQQPPRETLQVCGGAAEKPSGGGNADGSAKPRPPQTWVGKARARAGSGTATFRFGGDGGTGSLSFTCKLDGRRSSPCSPATSYRVRPGRHSFEVAARDELGRADPTPATQSFQVRRARKAG